MTTIATASVTSSAPPAAFFARWADMASWSEWNTDTEWVRLDGPFAEGATGALKPRGGPTVRFRVERLVPDREFVDVSRLIGARLTFAHLVSARDEGGCRVEVTISIAGPLAPLWRLALGPRPAPVRPARPRRAGPGGRAARHRRVSERRLATEHPQADHSPGLLLWQVTNRWQAAIRAALKPHGLTHVQFVLLASLTWLDTDGPVTQRALADHAVTDPMMTSQVLRTLQAAGLIERVPHPTDGRARALAVTPAGAELANAANTSVEECDRRFFAALGGGGPAFTAALRALASA